MNKLCRFLYEQSYVTEHLAHIAGVKKNERHFIGVRQDVSTTTDFAKNSARFNRFYKKICTMHHDFLYIL